MPRKLAFFLTHRPSLYVHTHIFIVKIKLSPWNICLMSLKVLSFHFLRVYSVPQNSTKIPLTLGPMTWRTMNMSVGSGTTSYPGFQLRSGCSGIKYTSIQKVASRMSSSGHFSSSVTSFCQNIEWTQFRYGCSMQVLLYFKFTSR